MAGADSGDRFKKWVLGGMRTLFPALSDKSDANVLYHLGHFVAAHEKKHGSSAQSKDQFWRDLSERFEAAGYKESLNAIYHSGAC